MYMIFRIKKGHSTRIQKQLLEINKNLLIHLEYFSSVYVVSKRILPFPAVQSCKKLENKLKTGTDEIPLFVVKYSVNILCVPLKHIFNVILRSHTYPNL